MKTPIVALMMTLPINPEIQQMKAYHMQKMQGCSLT